MLLKTKLLLSLGTLGVASGTGAGVYLLKNKEEEDKTKKPGEQPSLIPNTGEDETPAKTLNEQTSSPPPAPASGSDS